MEDIEASTAALPAVTAAEDSPGADVPIQGGVERGRPTTTTSAKKAKKKPESAIDILYENERGGFLCCMPLFSSRALGNLDPSPWTNVAQKTSITNPTNAQVPDPTWVWAWKEWTVNHDQEVDEDGWEYSFAFAKFFSWHGPSWWNSFVRRRAWTRKRVKKYDDYHVDDDNVLNPEYFVVNSAEERSRSKSAASSTRHRKSLSQHLSQQLDHGIPEGDISDIKILMMALKAARIDREKLEIVENFIKHGGDELRHLGERMHDIMRQFIFQASRRALLSHLTSLCTEASDAQKDILDDEKNSDPQRKQLIDNLAEAVKAAEAEVQKLEFWSDVKDMAEKGEIPGAVDGDRGWGKEWVGLDQSGPQDVISNRDLPGTDNCEDGEGNGTSIPALSKESEGQGLESIVQASKRSVDL